MSSPASKCPAQQIFETLQVNHKTEKLPPPPLQTQRGGVGAQAARAAAFRTSNSDTREAPAND